VLLPVHHHKLRTSSLKAGPYIFPMQGSINQYAEFFVNISLGNPPQILRVQVDTGSTDLVVFGDDCHGCPKANNVTYFLCGKSKSCVPISCNSGFYDCNVNNCWLDDYCPMDIEYGGGGSIQGYAVQEVIQLGALQTRVSLGVIEDLRGPFENLGVDGCWGFAYQELSSWGDDPVISHFSRDLKLYDSFSMCLTPSNAVLDIGTNYQGDSRFEWTKVGQQIWYTVDMLDFLVNNVTLGLTAGTLNSNGVIVDSGTTLVIVSKRVLSGIKTHLTSFCETKNLVGICNATAGKSLFDGYCFPMTASDVSAFPPISTTLKGLTHALVMRGTEYLWEGAGEEGVYCLGIQTIVGGEDLPLILGDVIMQNYHVVFDRVKNMVGFGPLSSCPAI